MTAGDVKTCIWKALLAICCGFAMVIGVATACKAEPGGLIEIPAPAVSLGVVTFQNGRALNLAGGIGV